MSCQYGTLRPPYTPCIQHRPDIALHALEIPLPTLLIISGPLAHFRYGPSRYDSGKS